MYEDKTLVCKECGKEFTFTAGEQEFYAERGFVNEPQRCKECRDARKNKIKTQKEMYTTTCAACGCDLHRIIPERTALPIWISQICQILWISEKTNGRNPNIKEGPALLQKESIFSPAAFDNLPSLHCSAVHCAPTG